MPPSFKVYNETRYLRHHLSYFMTYCCNVNDIDALLFKLFSSYLVGPTLYWYADFPGSCKIFIELEDVLVK